MVLCSGSFSEWRIKEKSRKSASNQLVYTRTFTGLEKGVLHPTRCGLVTILDTSQTSNIVVTRSYATKASAAKPCQEVPLVAPPKM
jgi:hypothetical protein